MVGLYGVIAYLVTRRRSEIGIRLALGARPAQVVGMVMGEAARLLAVGLSIGSAIALAAGGSVSALLFGLTPRDVPTLAGACLLLGGVAAIASFLPARRAATLDPLASLRHD
jgi:ABC-type antimicrobial peptide transport system permease subunit